jgi:hypothetical protein
MIVMVIQRKGPIIGFKREEYFSGFWSELC